VEKQQLALSTAWIRKVVMSYSFDVASVAIPSERRSQINNLANCSNDLSLSATKQSSTTISV